MRNERNAGRKRKFDPETIKRIVELYEEGRGVSELAKEYGVSRQTMSFYVHDVSCEMEIYAADKESSVIREYTYWRKLNREFSVSAEELEKCRMRMEYMSGKEVFTSILVNFCDERIHIKNFTEHPLKCAFGIKRNPDWDDFQEFLEERCVPRTRDHMKIVLKDYGLDFYDTLSIIEKTGGRMAGDQRHIMIYRLEDPS